ncbi:MAG: LacI family transcriptional regulator [Tenuifilum sp.]|jgi:LacI family transcriptional regulator|uniref:LacI family DNA-binding transcriptional regulator n=1 Tax=Tenuifilum sp. TaxID=2760880 RepID=UPI0024AC5A3D|nr:LacI family DNA-binding transcriptional regulator [Tenuifilum sp.]MDI3527548.1 LacI family transcriptional regulator [Tenuifilum sp.]
MKSSQVTIKDIARELGISPSTVSRALKDHPDISQETKRLVNELAKKYNYKPNAIALSLRNQRSNVIGVVIPEIVHYFFSSVISGIEEVANANGYSVMISQSNEDFNREVAACETFLNGIIDGVLISVSKETNDYTHFHRFEEEGIPIVFFDRSVDEIQADRVIIDDFDGAYQATEHLIVQGRRKIVHFAGPQNRLIGQNRLNGYLKAMRDNGVVIDERLIIPCDTFQSALVETQKLIESGLKFDSIFTVNDFTAAGALKILHRNGYKVPDDIAVVGFGDDQTSLMVEPTLTTVNQPGFEMGKKAMEQLIRRITQTKPEPPVTELLKTQLIVRESSRS